MKLTAYPLTADLQAALVRLLVVDTRLLTRLAPHLNPERLSSPQAQLLVTCALGYYKVRGLAPSTAGLAQEVRLQVTAGQVTQDQYDAAIEYLDAAHDGPQVDSGYVVDLILREERASAMWQALDQALVRSRLKTPESYDAIEREVSNAARLGISDSELGIDQYPTLGARTDDRRAGKVVRRHGTGIALLDNALNGGLAAGELGCVLGAAKAGKTTLLSQISLYRASLGKTSVFLTLEMSKEALTDRHDAAISNIAITALGRDHALVEQRVSDWFDSNKGRVMVRYLKPYETTVKEIRAVMQQMRLEEQVVPDILCVDYAGRVGSVRKAENRYNEVGHVYTELRDLAIELQIPVWTGHQANREAIGKEVITMANLAESFKVAAECDCLIAVCQTEEEQLNKQARFVVVASRFSPGGACVGPMETGLECGRIVSTGGGLDSP